MSDIYHVSVSGELMPGFEPAEVQQNIKVLFKLSDEKLAMFFAGERLFVKRNLDQATAEKYQGAIEKAGMRCEMHGANINLAQSTETQSAPTPKPLPIAAETEVAAVDSTPRASETESSVDTCSGVEAKPKAAEPEQAETTTDADFSIAPVGVALAEQSEFKPLDIDVSHLELGAVGETMDQAEKSMPPVPPDTSHLTLKDDK